jgi:hypothetical protein
MRQHYLKRGREYAINFLLNGFIFFTAYMIILYFFVPHTFYFDYESVELREGETPTFHDTSIKMISSINYNRSTDPIKWNDVLRCDYGTGGYEYVGEWNTSWRTPKVEKEPFVSRWSYWGKMPETSRNPDECIMDSTITKLVYGFIPKRQNVVSDPFPISY